jgi:membrane protease YdiL (CAAX protease family)
MSRSGAPGKKPQNTTGKKPTSTPGKNTPGKQLATTPSTIRPRKQPTTPPAQQRSVLGSANLPKWNRPIPNSTYPVSLVHDGEDPNQGSIRFMGGVMVVMVLFAYFLFASIVNTAVIYVGFVKNSRPGVFSDFFNHATSHSTIWGVMGSHLGLASLILVVWLYVRFIHRRRFEWVFSVSPGIRWRYAIVCLGVALIVVGAVASYYWMSGPGFNPIPSYGTYLAVILVTVPLQALGEEILFRGYLMQLFGSIVRNEWFAIVATALVFAVFHGTQNPWLFGSRFVFGMIAGILVWRTGGLEAAVAIHIINNLVVFAMSILNGTLVEVRSVVAAPWTQTLSDTVMFAVCALGCWLVALKMRVPIRVHTPQQH